MMDDRGERAVYERVGRGIPLITFVEVAEIAMIQCFKDFGEVDIDYCVQTENTRHA